MLKRGLAVGLCLVMLTSSLGAFLAMAVGVRNESDGTPEVVLARIGNAGTAAHMAYIGSDNTANTGDDQANGICYTWLSSRPWSPTVTVAMAGWDSLGLGYPGPVASGAGFVDEIGGWRNRSDLGAPYRDFGQQEAGSVIDVWNVSENVVQVYETFCTNTSNSRNYTCIFEDQIEGDGATNMGPTAPPPYLTPISDPILLGAWVVNQTAIITIATQSGGAEVASLLDGYGVYKSANPITNSNRGTYIGDAIAYGSNWRFIDTSFTSTAYYAVKVKWDGGSFPFYQPIYSYGMSNDVASHLGTEPISSVNSISPYWRNMSPLAVTATAQAFDGAFILDVTLKYRFSSNNATWGAWTTFGKDFTAPWEWSFNWPSGQGYYEFYSIANDTYGWTESPPSSADARGGYDTTPPERLVGVPIEKYTRSNPLLLTSSLGDLLSGMGMQYLYWSYDTPMSWQFYGTTYNGTWSFNWPFGEGTYYFAFEGWDRAGNYLGLPMPGAWDDHWTYDGSPPMSNVNSIIPYFYHVSPILISVTVAESPPATTSSVSLWFRFSSDNSSWGAWTMFNNDTAAPFGPWSFTWPSGQGYYEFYSRAGDNFGDYEAAPANPGDDNAMFEIADPASTCTAIGYFQNANITMSCAAPTDAAPSSGVDSVGLYYRFGTDNATWGAWTLFNNDTTAPFTGSWTFTWPSGVGYYEFHTRAGDQADNWENTPATADTRAVYLATGPTIATATGPIGGGPLAVTITYVWTDSPASVNLYYTTNGGTTWTLAGNDATVEGSFAFVCPAAGTYGWIASAVGGTPPSTEPSPPPGGTAPEAAPYYIGGFPRAQSLWVERSSPHVILHWTNTTNPTTCWTIYYSTDKFASFPSGWNTATTVASARSWTHANALTDGLTWFYIVRANNGGMYSANSTMGVKVHRSFTVNAAPQTNVMWVSIPYKSHLKTARDIVKDIEGGDGVNSPSTKIDVVGKWLPSLQLSTTYYWDPGFGPWGGDDFAINPGDGIYVSIISTFNWVINGTDKSQPLTFTFNPSPQTNVMWFILPSTCIYTTARDIVIAIEGGNGITSPSTKIDVVGKWWPNLQASTMYYHEDCFMEWDGDNFAINPGDGICINVISSFDWTPALITPEVP
jgi:hypothetical protein